MPVDWTVGAGRWQTQHPNQVKSINNGSRLLKAVYFYVININIQQNKYINSCLSIYLIQITTYLYLKSKYPIVVYSIVIYRQSSHLFNLSKYLITYISLAVKSVQAISINVILFLFSLHSRRQLPACAHYN